MKTPCTTQSTYWLLLQAMMRSKHRLATVVESFGLTGMQANVLGLLEPGQARPMNTLSEQLACDASNVTGLADRLERQEFIERQDHPDDRRVKMIILTAKGEKVRAEIFTEMKRLEDAQLAVLSADERQALDAILLKLSR